MLDIWNEDLVIQMGEAYQGRGRYAHLSLESATKALRDISIDVLVTAPINKSTIQSEDFNYPGHTEYLESKLEGNSLMILMTNELRIGLVTGHIPLAVEVSRKLITPELIEEKVNIMHHSLVKDFHVNVPKIAILGLNPHSGDHGAYWKRRRENYQAHH